MIKHEKRYKTGWSLNKKDRSYLLAYRINDFNNSRIDFEGIVLDWLEATKRRAEGIKGFDTVNSNVAEIESWVRIQMNLAVKDKELSTAVINMLNKKLTQGKSKLFISNKRQGYVITTRTKAQQDIKVSSNAELFEKVRARFYSDPSLNTISEEQAMYLVYEKLRNEKIHPSLITKDLARGEESLYSALTSLKSKFKKADGFAHEVFQGDYKDKLDDSTGITSTNIVINVLKLGRTLSEIRDYFVDIYLEEINAENRDNDDREAAQKASEDELNEALENYLKSKEFAQYNSDFDASVMGQLLNGTYEGTRDQLKTDVEKRTFDEMDYANVSEKKEDEDGEEEDDDFGPKNTLSPIQKKTADFIFTNPQLNNARGTFNQHGALMGLINDNLSFKDLAVLYVLSVENLLGHSREQNKGIIGAVLNQLAAFGNNYYTNVAIDLKETGKVPAGVYAILNQDTVTNTPLPIKIQNLETNEVYTIEPIVLLNALNDVLDENTLIENKSLNFTATNDTIEDAMSSISDIFSNFKEGIDEFKDLEEDDLMSKIVDNINNCKL